MGTQGPFDGKIYNWYRWTFYINVIPPDFVEQAEICPDQRWFPNTLITKKQPPFEYTTEGWGSVTISTLLVLKDGWKFGEAPAQGSSTYRHPYTLRFPSDAELRTSYEADAVSIKICQMKGSGIVDKH